jgi:hypothetical protein
VAARVRSSASVFASASFQLRKRTSRVSRAMPISCCCRSRASSSPSRRSIADSRAAPVALTSAVISSAFWISSVARTGEAGARVPATAPATSIPAAVARDSRPGSRAGVKIESWRTTPVMSRQLRILKRRSATVSQ